MSKENPFNRPHEEPIEGEGFTMRETTPEEKKRSERATWNEQIKKDVERTRNFTEADHAEDLLNDMLKTHNPYSETFKIRPDGTFDKVTRLDGSAVYLGYGDNPNELYKIAAEIEKKHPGYKFDFQTDPEGKWMRYTVSKTEKGS